MLRRIGRGLLPVGILVLACVVSAAFLSCNGNQPPAVQRRPVRLVGVPRIRVRLIARPVSSIRIGSPRGLRVTGHSEGPGSIGPGTQTVRRQGRTWRIGRQVLAGGPLTLEPIGEGPVQLNDLGYRGRLRLVPASDGFRVINETDLESYLAGVLARELISRWHPEAFRAQAVAARTFALYQMSTFGASHGYDVNADQSSQVYGGVSAETDRAWRAVRDTHGTVLTYDNKVFRTQYSSTCGGVVNDAEVLQSGPDIPPLRGGQVCTDCSASPKYRWSPVRVPKWQVFDALRSRYDRAKKLADVNTLRVVERTGYGRVVWLDAVDRRGKHIRLRAADLRMALLLTGQPSARKLYSMNCRILDDGDAFVFADGHGFGHGVGLCQWGCQGKASQGWSAERILEFYYPQSQLTKLY
jgi:stage II sporulation protein D